MTAHYALNTIRGPVSPTLTATRTLPPRLPFSHAPRRPVPPPGTETVTWNIETPGSFGIGSVTTGKRPDHASRVYCICDDEQTCQKQCADIN